MVAAIALSAAFSFNMNAQDANRRYIDVVGSCEMEIVPDEIHFIIKIKEYFKEEFEGKSKPETYKTKIPIAKIEKDLRAALKSAGINDDQIRVEEVGDYWRERGLDFLIGKNFDITLNDFTQIDKIVANVDTKGISSMRIGKLNNRDMVKYHEQGKIEALKAAQRKAAYMLEAVGEKLGEVIYIVEPREGTDNYVTLNKGNVRAAAAWASDSYGSPSDQFKIILLKYSVNVRFAIADKE